jgi:hypothetical protein
MTFMDFSSWPREQEQSFVVYEQRAKESQSKAFTMGVISAVIVFVAALGIYAGVEPDKRDLSQGMNMSNLTKKSRSEAAKSEQPKAEPAKTETPAATPPAETPPSDKK